MEKKTIWYEGACIFSIIGSSLGFIGMFITGLFFKSITEKIISVTNITATEKLSPLYFALLMVAFCISLVGAINLYSLKRSGLYFYITAQLVIAILPVIWIGPNSFSVMNAFFALLFSGVYLIHYRITS